MTFLNRGKSKKISWKNEGRHCGFCHRGRVICWTPPNEGATNESGFNGLPGGYRDGYGYYFMGLGTFGQY